MPLSDKETQAQAVARMRELRLHFRRTLQEAADALGISLASYAQMERGETRVRRRDLVTLSVLYGLTPDVAFPGLTDTPQRRPFVDLSAAAPAA